jgi:hypothetical protein
MSNTAVTAKVRIQNKTEFKEHTTLTFYADYADGRNKEWAYATPSLSVQMTVRPEVGQHFEQGKAYTLTFTPSED